MKAVKLAVLAFVFSPAALAGAPGDLDAAVRAFFAKNGANGALETLDPATGAKRALTLPAQPEAVYRADKFHVVSYKATDAKAQPVDVDVFVKGDDGEREVGLVYVSARPVVQEMEAKGQIAKLH